MLSSLSLGFVAPRVEAPCDIFDAAGTPCVAAYSARTIECAATHGVPAAARMSHGAVEAAEKPRA